MSASDSTKPAKDTFVRCAFACSKCSSSGYVKVWVRPGENKAQAALGHQGQTRGSCVSGCRYIAQVHKR